ncbi:MAG: alcohol dehydrogenase [Piccolia ochrophora]|nr:MAG: alcohol dehydrogenase [Piccolia ochrophora]
MGLPADAFLRASVFPTVTRMVNIKGSYVGNRKDTAEAIDFFRRGLINAPIKTVGLKDLPMVFDKMKEGQIAGRYVLDMSQV